jgi:hypothetical protein
VQWVESASDLAPGYLHLHPNVERAHWVQEFSQYDAGWLHAFPSRNGGEMRRATWDDLNYPARLATLAVAGTPLIQADNSGHIVATQTLARERNLGVLYTDIADLSAQLRDRARMDTLRASVWRQRASFTFDAHADTLIAFFQRVIGDHTSQSAPIPLAATLDEE